MKWINDRSIWVYTLIFSVLSLSSFAQSFTDVAATVNAQIGTGSKDGGQSWADFNQDGYLDLLVNTNNGTSDSRLLFWNSVTGQYDDVTASHAPDLLLNTLERSALAGDFDNDGDLDFMRSRASRLEIYQNQGPLGAPAYSFVLIQVVDPAWFTGLGTQGGMNNEGLAWMDFDGDGDLDVYMEDHQYGQDILENDGTGVFTHYTPNSDPKGLPTTGSSGDYSVTADLDNNGDVDIVARREGTAAALDEVDIFMNNGDGTFTDNNTLNLDTRNGFKGGVAVADFDLDGDFDYFWTNNGTASGNVTHVIAEQTGLNSGTFALATVTITPAPSWTGQEIEGIAMGDVNNDGKVDVFLAPDSGPGYLLINTTTGGTFSFSHNNSGINIAGDGEGATMGDYDNDGDLDLYVNIRNGNNQLWENDLGGNTDYLKVEPLIDLGGGITRSATGATAVLELKGCTNLKFIQEVSGGVGHGSQNDSRLHFGLPDGPNVQYKLTVSFVRPNGGGRTIVEKYVTPSAFANQTIQILDTDTSDPNAHPTPAADSFTVPRNSINNVLNVLLNDTDPNSEDLSISLLNAASTQGGTVAVNDNATPVDPTDDFIQYTPPASFSGVDNFTYHVTNTSGFCSSADVTVTVNTPPTGDNNTVTTDEDVTYTFGTADFTVNYNDANSDPFAEIRITSLESVGSLLLGGSPVALNDIITAAQITANQLTFVPVAGQSGSPYDSFDFEVGDGTDFSTSDYTLTLDVNPVNDPPTGDDNTVTTDEDVTYVFAVADFTVNYSDLESDPFAEIRITNLESAGSLLLGGSPVALNDVITSAQISGGQLTFVPIANQSGSPYDSFDFEVGDGMDFSTSDYTLTLNANPVNDPPAGDDNTVTTDEDVTYTFSVTDFTNNYTDPDGDPFLEIQITSLASVGSLLFNGNPVTVNQVISMTDLSNGLLTFESLPDENGTPYDSFDFEVGDGSLFSLLDYTITINVNSVDDLPISSDKSVDTPEDTPYVFSVSDFSFSRIRITRLESVGELLLNGNPVILNQVITIAQIAGDQLVFIPQPNGNGSPYDTFDFEVGDNFNFNPTDYTVTINVLSVNDPPTSTNVSTTIDEDTDQPLDAGIFTGGYSDPDGDPLTEIRITTLPTTGTLYYNGNPVTAGQVIPMADIVAGLVSFEPLPGESGVSYDSFEFEVGDGTSFSSTTSTFTINVNAINDIPLAVDDNVDTPEDTALSIDVLANDTQGDAPTLINAVDAVTAQGGTAVINNNGTPADPSDDFIDYTPLPGFNGSDSFNYSIEDLDGESSSAMVTVDVTIVNDIPLAVNDTENTAEEVQTSIDVLINDNLGDTPTTISNVDNTTAQGGIAVINNNGTPADPSDDFIDYTPSPNFNGVDTFDYTIEDSDGETSTATVTITVAGVNDVPLAVDDNGSTVEDTMVAIDVLANDNLGDEPTSIITTDASSAQGGTIQINDNATPADPRDDFIEFTPANGYTGIDSFTYTIEDSDGETSTATVTIDISLSPSTLAIYKGFSPNGDGSNDEWVIDGILQYPANSVQIFNRWGNLVYKESGYDNQTRVWFGQSNEGWVVGDNILPDGTYFYMVDLGDGSEIHSGYVMLKR